MEERKFVERSVRPHVDLTEPKLPVLRVDEYYVDVELGNASKVDTIEVQPAEARAEANDTSQSGN